MDGIKKQAKKSGHNYSSTNHRTLQKSSTLNRKFVRRPLAKSAAVVVKQQQQPKITSSAMRAAETMRRRQLVSSEISRDSLQIPVTIRSSASAAMPRSEVTAKPIHKKTVVISTPDTPPVAHPTARLASARAAARKAPAPQHLSASQLKDRAIKQALQKVATMGENQEVQEQMTEAITKKKGFWQKRKLVIAVAMSIISVGLLGYLVHLNLPDLSVRVAAMQTGIDNAYPSYIPKNYRLDGLVTEQNGKIVMSFSGKDNASFTLTAEKSTWDSSAVLANFVTPKWGNDHVIVKGQGLTIYISGSNAAWVNGGILYIINDSHGLLSKQQLHDIAVSL